MPTLAVNDTTLHYERTGRGPALLFVHGSFGHADVWADQAERLADRATCVRYDRRGHSRSARGDAPLSVAQHADDAAGLIEALDLAPCLVVGSSFGGVITLDLALRHAHLVRGVVLGEPPLFSLDPSIADRAVGEIRSRVDRAVARGGLRAGADAFLSFVCAEMWAILDDDRKDRLRDNAEVAFADMEAPSLDVDAGGLSAIASPALVIAGTTSVVGLRDIARRLAQSLADSRFVEIAGGHVPYVERPEEFADVVSTFAAELGRRAPVSTP